MVPLSGKVCVVTGANQGIGKAAAVALAKRCVPRHPGTMPEASAPAASNAPWNNAGEPYCASQDEISQLPFSVVNESAHARCLLVYL